MATGFPTKANWAAGDVLTASALDDLAGTVNILSPAGITSGYALTANGTSNTVTWAPVTSATSYGFTAGKNQIINGAFNVWQRGTSFTPVQNSQMFTADRFFVNRDGSGATVTVSQQTFTPGTAPVSGYEGTYFYRYAQTVAGSGATYSLLLQQRVEDVRNLAGQTVTWSFWAKADTARNITTEIVQNFGTGGSSSTTNLVANPTLAITTSWTRYTITTALPSLTGKTIGTNSFISYTFLDASLNATKTVDTWGWQVEAGSAATAFQTATGTLQGELTACQRYYEKSYPQGIAPGTASSTAGCEMYAALVLYASNNLRQRSTFKTTKRTSPTVTIYSTNNGATGNWYNEGLATNVPASAYNIGDSGFLSYQTSGTTNASNILDFHYTADSEL